MVHNISDSIININMEKESIIFIIKTYIQAVGNKINFMEKQSISIPIIIKNIKVSL